MGNHRLNNYVAVYIGSDTELDFFLRLSRPFREIGYQFIFVSNKLSIILRCLIRFCKYHLIIKSSRMIHIPDLSRCHDIISGKMNYENGEILYSSVFAALTEIYLSSEPSFIFIWNGSSVQGKAASDFARSNNIPKRVFELSNLPGKIFVNPEGVNAQSTIYQNPDILDNYPANEAEYLSFRTSYLQNLNQELPQQKELSRIHNYLFPADLLATKIFDLPVNGDMSAAHKMSWVFRKRLKLNYDTYDYHTGKFVFFPLQVNLDSQLIINSDIKNIEAIKIAVKKASEINADLVVKPHPAEDQEEFINQVLKLKNELKFFIVNTPVIELINYAAVTITINSTVGLQALIHGKKVEFLGRTFYALLDATRIRNYTLNYLADGEYFSKKPIPVNTALKILDIK